MEICRIYEKLITIGNNEFVQMLVHAGIVSVIESVQHCIFPYLMIINAHARAHAYAFPFEKNVVDIIQLESHNSNLRKKKKRNVYGNRVESRQNEKT